MSNLNEHDGQCHLQTGKEGSCCSRPMKRSITKHPAPVMMSNSLNQARWQSEEKPAFPLPLNVTSPKFPLRQASAGYTQDCIDIISKSSFTSVNALPSEIPSRKQFSKTIQSADNFGRGAKRPSSDGALTPTVIDHSEAAWFLLLGKSDTQITLQLWWYYWNDSSRCDEEFSAPYLVPSISLMK